MKALFTSILLFTSIFPRSQNISTIAGGTTSAGKAASDIAISPSSVTVDNQSNLYICDRNIIWKINNGKTEVVAGNTLSGYSGDGGKAYNSLLSNPEFIYYDQWHNDLYISDQGGTAIRKIGKDSIITTIVGTGQAGSSDDSIPALGAAISGCNAISVDRDGNLFFGNGNLVRKVDTTGILTTVAGGGPGFESSGDGGPALAATLKVCSGIAVDTFGNFFITEYGGNKIRRVNTSGIISTVAGNGNLSFSGADGPAVNAGLGKLSGSVAFDKDSNMYVASFTGRRILMIEKTGLLKVLAGNGSTVYMGDTSTANATGMSYPAQVVVDAHDQISFITQNRLLTISQDGKLFTIAGTGYPFQPTIGRATDIQLYSPMGGSINVIGEIAFSCDRYIMKIDTTGELKIQMAIQNNADTLSVLMPDPGFKLLGYDNTGSLHYYENGRIKKITPNGIIAIVAGTGQPGYNGDGIPANEANIENVEGFAQDKVGNFYFSEEFPSRIRKIDTARIIHTIAGNGNSSHTGDGGLAIAATLFLPGNMLFDQSDNLIFTDGAWVRKINKEGYISTIAGLGYGPLPVDSTPAVTGRINPSFIAIDHANNLFIADQEAQRIWKVDTTGMLTIFGGNGINYEENDSVLNTKLIPNWLVFDKSGDMLIGETANHRIRKISFQTNKWTGNSSTNWEDPNNWSLNHVPSENDHVLIEAGTIVVNSQVTVRSLKLLPSVDFAVASGSKLNILY